MADQPQFSPKPSDEERSNPSNEIKHLPTSAVDDFGTGSLDEKIIAQDPLFYGLDSAYVAKA
jgi:hypothetical protein